MKLTIRTLILLLCGVMLMSAIACEGGTSETDSSSEEPTTEPSEDTTAADDQPTTEEVTTEEPDVMIGETLDAAYAADFTVSKVFTSDMVVQRGERLRVWGWAPESENGKKVSGEFMGMFAEALIENGEWTLQFGAKLDACAELGNAMMIYTDTKEIVFSDVLVGDVYMVIGQSNVAYSFNAYLGASNTDKANYGSNMIDESLPIRLHYNTLNENETHGYPKRGTTEVCRDVVHNRTWEKPSTESVGRFTAIGYCFAWNFVQMTEGKVPVGVIEIDGNGQPLGAFLPNEVADALKTDKWNESQGIYVPEGVNATWARYMYNHYMYPFEKYAMAGLIWYQGESDFQRAHAKEFVERFSTFMTYMRSTHNVTNPDFAVYMVEFPTIYERPSDHVGDWHYMDLGLIRCVVGAIPQTLPNSYLSVSSDLWADDTYFNSLHPDCKFGQGQRLAKLAAAVRGDAGTLESATGPIVESAEFSEDGKTVVLTFTNVGEGLTTSDGGTAVNGFTYMRTAYTVNNKKGVKISAEITAPNQVTVTCSASMKNGVVYNGIADNFYGVGINLCNSYGNPAGAFFIASED
ncbi:MAG: hypothetical protein IJW70_08295 [Clostridia bacterium]|nr:hypothetical protein [Clostridia bacterium]